MPTEADDNSIIPRTPPIETSSSRASFASCPPEEEREAHAPREARAGTPLPLPLPEPTSSAVDEVEHTTTQEESDARAGASDLSEQRDKGEHHVDDVPFSAADLPSPVGSPETQSDSDVRLAQSMATTVLREGQGDGEEQGPRYLFYPPLDKNRLQPNSTSSFLRPGSKFRGTQQSDRQVYDVQVEIKDVDMAESFLCGYLRIQGLTDDHPTLTTFFEGEIIGPKHLFRTTHASWNSSEKIDLQHWARFPAWRPLAKSARSSSDFTLKNYLDREHLFMRWKEYFLVPDHRVKSISGASFEGFYYICFDQRCGSVSGIYFHAKSEKYQQLELQHVEDRGCVGAVEFR